MHLTQALALQGDAAAARELLRDLEADRHPAYTLMEPEIELARAWVVASEGAISEAVSAAHAAADLARSRSSAAYEVLALQTALGFGDHTVGGRLAELAGLVEGPRAPTAARQAGAMASGDGDMLLATSYRWQELGDDLAAADAAAEAARAFMPAGSARFCLGSRGASPAARRGVRRSPDTGAHRCGSPASTD